MQSLIQPGKYRLITSTLLICEMREPVYIVDLFREIVEKTSTAFGQACHYEHGHPLEIVETLKELTANPEGSAGKYPLIALFQDFEEQRGLDGTEARVRLHLIIATLTDNTMKATQRYDVSFKPLLYPIYQEFLKQTGRSHFFREENPDKLLHSKYDRLYWGRNGLFGNDNNVFNDYIDCIEIKDLQLNVKQNLC